MTDSSAHQLMFSLWATDNKNARSLALALSLSFFYDFQFRYFQVYSGHFCCFFQLCQSVEILTIQSRLVQPPIKQAYTLCNTTETTQQKHDITLHNATYSTEMQNNNVFSIVAISNRYHSVQTVSERGPRAVTFQPVGRIDNSMSGCESCIWQQVGNPMFQPAIQCSFAIVPDGHCNVSPLQ